MATERLGEPFSLIPVLPALSAGKAVVLTFLLNMQISLGENATPWSKLESKITKLIAKGKVLGTYRKRLGGPTPGYG